MNKMFKSKKSQTWFIDMTIGISIFLIAIIIYFKFTSASIQNTTSITDLTTEGKIISDTILSAGYPSNWTNDSVTRVGIIDNNQVNTTKLSQIQKLHYSNLKSLINSRYDFYIFFSDNTDCLIDLGNNNYGFGHGHVALDFNPTSDCIYEDAQSITVNLDQVNLNKLTKIERFVVLNLKVLRMTIYIWD